MLRKLLKSGLLAAAAVSVSSGAQAASVGFQLDVFGPRLDNAGNAGKPNFNVLGFELTSIGTSDATLDLFTLTIGDESRNFDFVIAPTGDVFAASPITPPADGSADLEAPDALQDEVRANAIRIAFTGFDRNEMAAWRADIDTSNNNNPDDFRQVLFNNDTDNGAVANSVATALFSDGRSVSLTLPDGPADKERYSFSASVPLPAAAWMFLSVIGGAGLYRARVSSRKAIGA